MEVPADTEMLNRIQRGDKDAIALLFDRYQRPLCRYASQLLKDRIAAEDAVDDVFTMILSQPSVAQNVRSLRSWLFRVVRNRCLAFSRADRHNRAIGGMNEVWDATTPLDILAETDLQSLVRDAVGRLKEAYRDVVILREFEGMTYSEIAEVLEEPLSTVKFRLFKAREALVGLLGPLHRERSL